MADSFEWDENKNEQNQTKHNVSFEEAQLTFLDPQRIIYKDLDHSTPDEERFFCVGLLDDKVCTVRFTYRDGKIRIFGAGYWRKERRLYEQEKGQK